MNTNIITRGLAKVRFAPGLGYGFNDYGCSNGYPYYNPYNCYQSAY